MARSVTVVIQATPVVAYDRALYTVPDADFDRICAILARDPHYGQLQPDGRREMLYRRLRVSYICKEEEGKVIVTLTGLRPPEEVPQSARIARAMKRLAPVLLRFLGLLNK
jgi:hypothetical protein